MQIKALDRESFPATEDAEKRNRWKSFKIELTSANPIDNTVISMSIPVMAAGGSPHPLRDTVDKISD
jgi:hypothetical protein